MRDIFIETLYSCGTLLVLTGTLAAVRYLGQYIIRRAEHEIVVTGNTVTVASSDPKPTLIAVPAPEPVTHADEDYVVECGKCKRPILSKPLRTEMAEGGKARLVYKCEHCGTNVGVKT